MEKPHSNLLTIELAVEIHHVSLNGHLALLPDRRPVTDIRDRPKPLPFNLRDSNVHPICRKHRVLRLQIGRCVLELRFADPAAFDHAAFDAVRPAEHSARKVYSSFAEQP